MKPIRVASFRKPIQTILLLLVLSAIAAAQDVATQADQYLTDLAKKNQFSGTAFIAKGGKVVFSKGYGMANYELDVPNTPQTKFRLGSITKQFTSMAVMQLQEKGLLSVDDPITKYFPDYKAAEKVTIHHLLTHTGGIYNFTSGSDYQKMMRVNSPPDSKTSRWISNRAPSGTTATPAISCSA